MDKLLDGIVSSKDASSEIFIDKIVKEVINKIKVGVIFTFHHPDITHLYNVSKKDNHPVQPVFERHCYDIKWADRCSTLITEKELIECLKSEGLSSLIQALFPISNWEHVATDKPCVDRLGILLA